MNGAVSSDRNNPLDADAAAKLELINDKINEINQRKAGIHTTHIEEDLDRQELDEFINSLHLTEEQRNAINKRSGTVIIYKHENPSRSYYNVTGIVVIATFAIFILQLSYPWLTDALALSWSSVSTQPWTLLTCMFVHDPLDITHVMFNMIVLIFFGPLLEKRIGSARWLALYVGCGMMAGLAEVAFFPAYATIGASGAIMGVLGAIAILYPRLKVAFFFFIPMNIFTMILITVFMDLYPLLMSIPDNIGHVAHLVGLAMGLGAGYMLKEYKKDNFQP